MAYSDPESLDLSLAFQTRDLLKILGGQLPSPEEIRELAREKAIPFLNKLLHSAILQSALHGPFLKHLQALPLLTLRADGKRHPIEVVIVPSVSWGTHIRWGAHNEWIRALSRALGLTTDVIETDERESLTGNARLIGDYLQASRAERIILVTTGRGTSEFRMLLQRRGPTAAEFKKVRSWINIGGAFNGSRLTDAILKDRFNRWETQFDFWLHRRKFNALREFSSEFALWKDSVRIPDSMTVISAFGLPAREQVPLHLRKNFDRLSIFGPNDGGVPAIDSFIRPGFLLPVPGLTHQADEAILRPVLARALSICGEQILRKYPAVSEERETLTSPRSRESDLSL